jgi:hypothetical protein
LCGTRCVELLKDNDHCGRCNQGCGENEICSAGKCTKTCLKHEKLCSASCVNLSSNSAHCGKCGVRCSSKESCEKGVCQARTACKADEILCKGFCVKSNIDVKHCGGCDLTCGTGQICFGGKCYKPAGGEPVAPEPAFPDSGVLENGPEWTVDVVTKESKGSRPTRHPENKRGREQGCLCSSTRGSASGWFWWCLLGLFFWRRYRGERKRR